MTPTKISLRLQETILNGPCFAEIRCLGKIGNFVSKIAKITENGDLKTIFNKFLCYLSICFFSKHLSFPLGSVYNRNKIDLAILKDFHFEFL